MKLVKLNAEPRWLPFEMERLAVLINDSNECRDEDVLRENDW